MSQSSPQHSETASCRGGCSGYGTHFCCPPLIVIASQLSQSATAPSGIEMSASAGFEGNPGMSSILLDLASGEFCTSLNSHLTDLARTASSRPLM